MDPHPPRTRLLGSQQFLLWVLRLCPRPWGWSLPLEDSLIVMVLQVSSGVPLACLCMFCTAAVGSLDAPEKPSLDLSSVSPERPGHGLCLRPSGPVLWGSV